MKIAHIVSTYPPYYGGMGNVVFQTASALSKLGHEVEVFTPGKYEDKEIRKKEAAPAKDHEEDLQKDIDFAKRLKPSIRYGNAARLPTIQKELDRFDLVHLHYPFFGTDTLVRKWKKRNPKKPLVITYHMDARGVGWLGLIFKAYAKFIMPRVLNSADKILASSTDYIESSEAFHVYKKNKDKWAGLPFGVDIERFSPGPKSEQLFSEYNLDINKPTLLFVGGMDKAHYFKGIPVLLKALLILKNKGFDLQCVFVGDGDLRPEFEQQAEVYRLQDIVRFTGRVEDEDLPEHYRMGDLFVLPSIHQGEAFGMVLLESMASGVPVIASDLAGVRTVAADGGSTFTPQNVGDLAEAVEGFFSQSSEDRQEWKQKARGAAEEKYSWDKIASQLDKIYLSLVDKN